LDFKETKNPVKPGEADDPVKLDEADDPVTLDDEAYPGSWIKLTIL